ncbi:hypothetical protein SAMN04487995_4438 [Dyadobacter koreensis]|uniref:DUF5666 domain-containing protein n=1 Tax=Dyadobacter koreensis TaxID=408657 RepID=A0A1H6YDI7_9BACT|nr:hypothetical protein [Dyadobacter koreensis]SEJ39321.1 hypothetical protein SAMN04487995_4438 [Dyadobacter koreensis]
MKKLAMAVLAISALTCSFNAFAQIQGPVAGPPLAGPAGPGPRPPLGAHGSNTHGLLAVNTLQGKFVKLQGNDDFVIDGFYILSSADSVLVKFPSHMGTQVSAIAKQNGQVTVSGVYENAGPGPKEMRLVSMTASGKTLTETPPASLPEPSQQSVVTGTGKVTSVQTDREGRINGLFVDNKTILRLPPHVATQLGNSAAKGTLISFSGSVREKQQGEVMLEDYKVVRCSTITVNGQQYLVR